MAWQCVGTLWQWLPVSPSHSHGGSAPTQYDSQWLQETRCHDWLGSWQWRQETYRHDGSASRLDERQWSPGAPSHDCSPGIPAQPYLHSMPGEPPSSDTGMTHYEKRSWHDDPTPGGDAPTEQKWLEKSSGKKRTRSGVDPTDCNNCWSLDFANDEHICTTFPCSVKGLGDEWGKLKILATAAGCHLSLRSRQTWKRPHRKAVLTIKGFRVFTMWTCFRATKSKRWNDVGNQRLL